MLQRVTCKLLGGESGHDYGALAAVIVVNDTESICLVRSRDCEMFSIASRGYPRCRPFHGTCPIYTQIDISDLAVVCDKMQTHTRCSQVVGVLNSRPRMTLGVVSHIVCQSSPVWMFVSRASILCGFPNHVSESRRNNSSGNAYAQAGTLPNAALQDQFNDG